MNNPLLAPDWWYVRLYPGGLDRMDTAVSQLLPPLTETAQALGADRWFFIQYTDWKGPHLRLRVHANRNVVDHLHRQMPRLTRDLVMLDRQPVPTRNLLVPFDVRPFAGRHAGADPAVYEPEENKYGGPIGTQLAEEVFQYSSDLALWGSFLPRYPDRAALGVLLLRAAAGTLQTHGQGIDTAKFWERHLVWWTHDAGRDAGRLRELLRRSAEKDTYGIQAMADELALEPAVKERIRGWTQSLRTYLTRAEAARNPYTPGHLIFHQGHMMCNRLGILPREEAYLGTMAAV